MERKVVITAYKTKNEKLEQVRNIIGQLSGVCDGTKFAYQGMRIERHARYANSRKDPLLEVYDPDGEQVLTIQPVEHSSREIVELLDEARSDWTQEGIEVTA